VPGVPISTPESPSGDPATVLSEQTHVAQETRAAVVMGPIGPLTTAKPRVITAGVLDPVAEKRNIAEKLRMRRGGNLIPFEETSLDIHRQRSYSMDSDDEGSLMRLSNALSSLEKTATLKDYSGEAVAHEGNDSLHERLDIRPDESVCPASDGVSSTATVAVTAAADTAAAVAINATMTLSEDQDQESPLPVARPAKDLAMMRAGQTWGS